MKFMLMMNAPRSSNTGSTDSGDWAITTQWSPEDFKAHIGFMRTFNQQLKEAGELVSCEGLAGPGQAKLVRAGKGGAPDTDGPFPETKEFLAGYWIVDVESPEQAYAIAARASAAPGPGGKPLNMAIEVREVMSGPPPTE